MRKKHWAYVFLLTPLLCLTVGIAACGSGGDSSSKNAAAQAAMHRCEAQFGALVASLDALRGGLVREVSYRQYVTAVSGVRTTYDQVPFARLDRSCLQGVGRLAERTVNDYVRAADTWTRCVARDSCDPESVRPTVARQSWRAGISLSTVHDALPGLPAAYRKVLRTPDP